MAEKTEETEVKAQPVKPRIVVDYGGTGRWGHVYHIIDSQGREIALSQKDAAKLAKDILRIIGKE